MKNKYIKILIVILIVLQLVGCKSKEIRKIAGVWENKQIGTIELKEDGTFIFELTFETRVGKYTINENEIIIKGNGKSESDYKYYYNLENNILILSQREDMKALFGSENLIFNKKK